MVVPGLHHQPKFALHFRTRLGLLGVLLCPLIPPSLAHAQAQGPSASGLSGQDVGAFVVTVREVNGSSLNNMATVQVFTQRMQLYSSATTGSGSTRFEGVPLGAYVVVAASPGYEDAREEAELMLRNEQVQVQLLLRSALDPVGKPVPHGPPLLAPKAQKEMARGLEALRANRLDEARKFLTSAQKLAPNHPDINCLLGLLAAQSGNAAEARTFWEKAISAYPAHVFSLLSLGESSLRSGDLVGAKAYFDHAVAAESSSWRAHLLLAHVCLRQSSFADAQAHAARALDIGKENAAAASLVLAKALIAQDKREEAASVLQTFLKNKSSDPQAISSAQNLLDALSRAAENPAVSPPSSVAASESLPAPPPAPLPSPAKWLPPNVDDAVPPVDSGSACDLPVVLASASRDVLRFTKSVDRFTATEVLEHQTLDNHGIAASNETREFEYLVSIQEIRPGVLNVDEYRDGSLLLNVFPEGLATRGLPSIILIFHPANAPSYDFSCEGLGVWRGIPAWQVHFREKKTSRSQLRSYRLGGALVPIPLKGRAWVASSGSQILRVETDLREPMPQIKLLAEHQAIDYGPVHFQKNNAELWLPASTDFFLDFRGKHVHRRLSYTNYLLFSVDQGQQIKAPPAKDAASVPPPN